MLETERLILRPLEEKDIDAVYAMRSDADVMRFIREPQDRDESAKWIKLVSSRWTDEKIGLCAVIDKASEKFIGWCGLWRLPETQETEVGYAIDKNFWKRGLASEAASRCLEYGFEDLQIDKIVAVAQPENRASRRVMEKLGMQFDCIGIFYSANLAHYSITKNEWKRGKISNR